MLPGDRIAVLREVRLVAGVWAGSSLLQLAVSLSRVTGRRIVLGKPAFPHARYRKAFAGPGGKILKEAAWGDVKFLL